LYIKSEKDRIIIIIKQKKKSKEGKGRKKKRNQKREREKKKKMDYAKRSNFFMQKNEYKKICIKNYKILNMKNLFIL